MSPIRRLGLLSLAGLLTLVIPFLFGYHFTKIKTSILPADTSIHDNPNYWKHRYAGKKREQKFHLLLPATGPNKDFCKLLLSAGVLGYPEPIFVGWDGRGMYNGTESHLFKITETLTYLRSLPSSADDDLVLVLDAYDIWLQLRPDVLISRYFEVLEKNDARLRREGILGKKHAGGEVRHSLVFGPDKIFWPQGGEDAAVWAVPESTLPRNAFGPETDTDMFTARPRWMNSGTILGPVREMRDMFSATVDMLSRKYDANWEFHGSDQFYFSEVWAEQEINRMRLRHPEGEVEVPFEGAVVPDIPKDRRTEYGICLDYELDIFQTAAAFDHHLMWMRFNGSSTGGKGGYNTTSGFENSIPGKRIDQWTLPKDISSSEPPYAASLKSIPTQHDAWEDVMLGTNAVTQQPFPLFHVTGDKTIRDRWWPRMWFHPNGEELLRASKKKTAKSKDPATFAIVNGVKWKQARPDQGAKGLVPGTDEKGGAWKDSGEEYFHWQDMCGPFEDDVFLRERREEQ